MQMKLGRKRFVKITIADLGTSSRLLIPSSSQGILPRHLSRGDEKEGGSGERDEG
jgi:hypothetical protein